jgi:hypothetical protein
MYSPFAYEMAQVRVADRHRQAGRATLARTAHQSRAAREPQLAQDASRRPAIAVRRALTAWATHS